MYILFTGAPGSKWSMVASNIYWSKDIDHSDFDEQRRCKYNRDHIGAYWDPGMEFENTDWDGPFSGTGIRLIKSHTFAHKLDELKLSGHPIVMVYRNDFECLEWWKGCGEFKITYPDYKYFKNLDVMWQQIQSENKDIMQFVKDNKDRIQKPNDNVDLCRILNIDFPMTFTLGKSLTKAKGRIHNYEQMDIKVYVYK